MLPDYNYGPSGPLWLWTSAPGQGRSKNSKLKGTQHAGQVVERAKDWRQKQPETLGKKELANIIEKRFSIKNARQGCHLPVAVCVLAILCLPACVREEDTH